MNKTESLTGKVGATLIPNELIPSLQQGDQESWRTTVEGATPFLTRLLHGKGATREDAEDAIQEGWLQIYQVRKSIDPNKNPSGMLRIIVTRKNINTLRTRPRDPANIVGVHRTIGTLSLDERIKTPSGTQTLADSLQDNNPPVEEKVIGEIMQQELNVAIEGLPERYRSTILMKLSGLTIDNIAERTERPLGTVKTHHHQAIVRLRKLLSD